MRKWLPYLWTWPWDLLFWSLWILPFALFWGGKIRFQRQALVFNLKEDSWFRRKFYSKWGGTTLGHAIMYDYDVVTEDHPTAIHEQFHVAQYESCMLDSFTLGLILFFILVFRDVGLASGVGIGVWLTGYLRFGLAGWFSAGIVGRSMYRGSHHEIAAYAVDGRGRHVKI